MAIFLSLKPKHLLLCFLIIFFISITSVVESHIDESSLGFMSDALEWPTSNANLFQEVQESFGDEEEEETKSDRRTLFWRRVHYYISYGALSANRIPCPPRSGRSYYTHNCYKARGVAHPYSRGCSKITRCRR
ncbi:hypothetical protein MKW94_014726 [Papaver nudicaule]|uniref:Protein RALF-like 34 n=1 Tax=Papaver nudicaule TaxID=74823 RepID=A0AA41UYC4_PAPNU|nr:hypothetical protein [Papaver nudicaule]